MIKRNNAIQYTRGLAMLGVIGIHVGAYSLDSPHPNIHLFAALDIFTRFSVPIFFFLSSFGLFLNHDLEKPFSYTTFIKKRFRVVLLPYLIWSIIYLANNALLTNSISSPLTLIETLFFGLASYHLYFLVILLWFYILMPIWRIILRFILKAPLPALTMLLILQIAFNYYSSYSLHWQPNNYLANLFVRYRLNYLVLHYLFIFLFGAICALRLADFSSFIKKGRSMITAFFLASLTALLFNYYWLLASRGLTPAEAAGIVHQLSPIGVIYTLATSLFLFSLFCQPQHKLTSTILETLGHYSFAVYLVHPLILAYLTKFIATNNFSLNVPVVIAIFMATATFSLFFGTLVERFSQRFYLVGLLLTGAKQSPKTSPNQDIAISA
ncbi:MAG: acyltransferase 3 [Firmicutes bacterium]|nr:acyltransferase 3 [Bacillota bacterium]